MIEKNKNKLYRKANSFISKSTQFPRIGDCFRRTSVTIPEDTGADLTTIKRYCGWNSSTVTERYIENSLENKILINNKISVLLTLHQELSPQPSTSTASPVAHRQPVLVLECRTNSTRSHHVCTIINKR